MGQALGLLAILILVGLTAVFAMGEISFAGSRKVRLAQMAKAGDQRAQLVLRMKERSGNYFSGMQICINAVALLGGLASDSAFSGFFEPILEYFFSPATASSLAFVCSFVLVTMLFVLFGDLIPKRLAMYQPEKVIVSEIRFLVFIITVLKPFVWLLTWLSNVLMKFFNLPTAREDRLTSEDIVATINEGSRAGLIAPTEKDAIKNFMNLEDRYVPSAMTERDCIVYFDLDESTQSVAQKITKSPHDRFLVCDGDIDHVIGYVDSKEMLKLTVDGKPLSLKDSELIHPVHNVPDSLTLSELLEQFKDQRMDFAIVVNEYGLTMGLVTLKDILSVVIGEFSVLSEDEQIVQRSDGTWLVDGATPVDDVERMFNIDRMPEEENYETVSGFMMYMLRKIPKLTDKVEFEGYRFEVIGVENRRVDQVLVTKIDASDDQENTGESKA